jgi:hypothetical protein
MLATAKIYHPVEFADQYHIWRVNLSNDVSIFTTHPATPLSEEGALSGSPNYWVGSGRLPHSVQDENINLTIYQIPDKKGFMEESIVDFTHAYFPKDLMDEVILEGHYIFGRLGNTYIAMIGKNDLIYADGSTNDLIQIGKETYWITELSSIEKESFQAFRERIHKNSIISLNNGKQVIYSSDGKELSLSYLSDFKVNGLLVNLEYDRFDSPYSLTKRKSPTLTLAWNDKKLILDFYQAKRLVIN